MLVQTTSAVHVNLPFNHNIRDKAEMDNRPKLSSPETFLTVTLSVIE